MMIFTPETQFDHKAIRAVRLCTMDVLPPALLQDMPEYKIRARLLINLDGISSPLVFYGAAALSVISELYLAGYYTDEQRRQVQSLMQKYQADDQIHA